MCYNQNMRATFKYRLFPTTAQRSAMQRSLDACRWVYNQTLEVRRDAWQERQQSLSLYDTHKLLPQWKREKPELQQGFSQSLQDAQGRVDKAFRAFYRRVQRGEEKVGYPRFKGFYRYNSFTYKQYGNGVQLQEDGRLYLSKIGRVKIKVHRPLAGLPKQVTIQRDRIGNWYACFSCVIAPETLPPVVTAIGVDLGLSTFMTLSNGETIARRRWMQRDEQDLRRVQRKISRLPQDSVARRKAVRALNHIHRRIANRRRDFAHKVSRGLVNGNQVIIFENLDIAEMQQGTTKTISKGIADVAWGQVVDFTAYKAAWAGRTWIKVNPRGTTQGCSACGEMVPKGLSVRVHRCQHCGLVLDRDENAARNILSRGLATLRTVGAVEAPLL
jgi:putative transposase